MAENEQENTIVVKKVNKGGHGHHGGAWKIAFADFVTAMMAFFLLMWLLGSTSKAKLEGISKYFQTPLKIALSGGTSVGDRTSIIKGGGNDVAKKEGQVSKDQHESQGQQKPGEVPTAIKTAAPSDEDITKKEMETLKEIQEKIQKSIDSNPTLSQNKNQIKMEITPEGLRILIIDEQNRPMFATGSSGMEPYVHEIMSNIAKELEKIPNKLSISGYTDATPFAGRENYDNWDLSTERANTARRELINAGLGEQKIMRVVGLGSTVPLKPDDITHPSNRRISILVMNKNAEASVAKSTK